jgi:hypothetical protein
LSYLNSYQKGAIFNQRHKLFYTTKIIVTATVNDIKGDLFFNVIRMPYYKINLYDRGELLNRIEFDASTIVDYYVDFVSSLFMIIGNLVISLYFLFKISDLFANSARTA